MAAQEPISGNILAHDPSTMIKHGSRYYIFHTGQGISSKSSADKLSWEAGPKVFSNAPAWTSNAVPGFAGTFWAPDVIHLNGQYHLYYSVSTWGSQTSAIGLATSPSLDPEDPNYQWTDQGPVIQSGGSVNYNTIDPSVMLAADGRLWMAFGSYWTGIKLIELDPATGRRINPDSPIYSLAGRSPGTAIEAACLVQRSNYFYLFVNWDTCCAGVDSTYHIRVGRSPSVTGPYLDRNGVDLANSGGTMLLESTGRFIGPGHAGILTEGGTNWFTYHYYDGTNNGSRTLGLGRLYWTDDGWPSVTNDWCAFYPFEADAREHRRLFDGELHDGAAITNEAMRGAVLALEGTSPFVTLPWSVSNARTFAAWVKWHGGEAEQRIFDFGSNTSRYLCLSPAAGPSSRLRFAITTSGSSGELVIEAPIALPTNSWCHVGVTLDGTRGTLYLNGSPVATNSNLTLRPWRVLARSNYLGRSQSAAHPAFNGRLDSLRICGRTLSGEEMRRLSEAHPALAHRYSFNADASDPIGSAHGGLNGTAVISNGALTLNGSAGTYVNLPGGLVSGCSAVTVEFWATFGVNGNWCRVFDFGKTNGTNGQQFLFFSPRTGAGSHRFSLSTGGVAAPLDVPGTLDGRTVHVACLADPSGGYSAIYTNGLLERATNGSLPLLSGVNSALAYLGRSLFSADAWLNASLAEFRIYHGRLTPEEIAANDAAGPDALAIPVRLSATSTPPELVFTWPAYAVGFVLEFTPSLEPGAIWSLVAQVPAIEDGSYRLTLTMPGETQFFRLRR